MGRIHENRSIHQPIRQAPPGVALPRDSAPAQKLPEGSEEVPEVLDLRPLSRHRTLARVSRTGAAEFRFVTEDD